MCWNNALEKMKVFDLTCKIVIAVVLLYMAYQVKILNNTMVQYFEPIMPEWSEQEVQ